MPQITMQKISGKELLDLYAAISRAAYIRQMTQWAAKKTGVAHFRLNPKWDGGKDENGKRGQDIWTKIARFMLRHGLNPDLCIEARFRQVEGTSQRIMPDGIAAPKHLDMYRAACQVQTVDLRRRLATEQELCRTEFEEAFNFFGASNEEATKLTILSSRLEVSPLFRFCMAESEGLRDLAEMFKAEAVVQYLMSPKAYDKAWGRWLPEYFVSQAVSAMEEASSTGQRRRRKDG